MLLKKISLACVALVLIVIRIGNVSTVVEFDFLDVGQGDGILITMPNDYQILIDGGPDNTVLEQLRLAMNIGDNKIDLVILSHGDSDHLAGLVDVLDNYDIEQVMIPDLDKETFLYEAFLDRITLNEIELIRIGDPRTFQLEGISLEVIAPTHEILSEKISANNSSIVVKAIIGGVSFLLVGDIELEVEDYLVGNAPQRLPSTVLKVPHHGSRSSSSKIFLEHVRPQMAIIQVGEGNKFEHPHQSVLYRYDSMGIPLLRTDQQGTIELTTDGATIWREYPRWKVFPQLFGKRQERVYNVAE